MHIVKVIPEVNTITNVPTGKAEIVIRTNEPDRAISEFS
jgi:hypothetical protein